MATLFTYTPLTEEHEIRVLSIWPAQGWDSPLIVDLHHVDLETDHVFFEALLPVARTPGDLMPGNQELGSVVFRAGGRNTRHPVAPSLESALRHLRGFRATPRVLWVEAVCVDQSNPLERAFFRQAQNMMRVYEAARGTISWIGPEEIIHGGGGNGQRIDSNEGMRCIRWIGGWAERYSDELELILNGQNEFLAAQVCWDWAFVHLQGHDWRSLGRLLDRMVHAGAYRVIMPTVGGERAFFRGRPGLIYCGRFRVTRSQWNHFLAFYTVILRYLVGLHDTPGAMDALDI